MEQKKAVKRLKQQDTAALEWIISAYAGYVGTIVFNIIGHAMSAADIEEVISDVFLSLWNNTEKVQETKLKAYLGSIARSRAKNKLRELSDTLPMDDDIIIISPSTPEGDLLKAEEAALVRNAVLSLTQPDGEIYMRDYEYYQRVKTKSQEWRINISTL